MKLSFELKLEIYEKHLEGYSFDYLANEYHLADTTVRHFCNLADRHGTDILRRSKKKTYSNQFKLNAINRVLELLNNCKQRSDHKHIMIDQHTFQFSRRFLFHILWSKNSSAIE